MSTRQQQTLTNLIAERTPAILQAYANQEEQPIVPRSAEALAAAIDHTLLKPEATEVQIRQLCAEAKAYQFASVCVNPTWVSLCAELLEDSSSVVCTVVGFPLGATLMAAKAHEAEQVVQLGAREVDMVLNIGRLKDGDYATVHNDIAAVVETAQAAEAVTKVIIETCLLTQEEKIAASLLTQMAGADFVKTSTGFNSGGATVDDVRLMRLSVGEEMELKAAGGVRTADDAFRMFAAGATRLGASAGVAIVKSLQAGDATSGHTIPESPGIEGKETY